MRLDGVRPVAVTWAEAATAVITFASSSAAAAAAAAAAATTAAAATAAARSFATGALLRVVLREARAPDAAPKRTWCICSAHAVHMQCACSARAVCVQ